MPSTEPGPFAGPVGMCYNHEGGRAIAVFATRPLWKWSPVERGVTVPETNNLLVVGNAAYLNMMDERFLVEILGTENNKIWVSFPGACYPLNGMGGRLEFHRPDSVSAYNVQVLRYAEGQARGIILERSESADHRTHRTSWRVPTNIQVAIQLDENDHRYSAVMENLSAEGALLRATPTLALSTPLRIAFPLDKEHGIQVVEGRVRYAHEAEAMADPPVRHYGVRFTGMSGETRRLLTLFLYHHIRKLYPKEVAAMYPRNRRSRNT